MQQLQRRSFLQGGNLLLLDGDGTVRWRGHGVFREQDYAALQTAAKGLAAQS